MNELRIAQSQVNLLQPEFTTDQPDLQSILALVYEPLMQWRSGRVAPGLVASWEVRDDGRSWLLTLRDDVRFHDGSLCATDDVVQSLERMREAGGAFGMGGVYSPYLEPLSFEPVGKTQLLVKSSTPTGDLADIFAAVYVGKQRGPAEPPLGTGPFRLEEYVEGELLRLSSAARPDHNSQFSELTISQMPSASDRYSALLNDQADLATGLELMQPLPENDGLTWRRSTNTLSVIGFLNGYEKPFSQPEARLAINFAVDLDAIIDRVWPGLAEPAATVVSPFHFGFSDALRPHAYDPERARELFNTCDMPEELVLRTPLVIPDRAPQVAAMIQEQLAHIGIHVRIESESDRPKYAMDTSQKRIGHLALFDSSPLSTYRVLQEKISSQTQGLWWQGVTDSQADQLIDAAHLTLDNRKRSEAYSRCLSWLHANPHWLYLYHPVKLYAHRAELSGIEFDHAGLIRLNPASTRAS
ncbi:MAG: ABC transporter substrate-binding protein [Caldilineaceae bacterium]|nr:ABC transporter substrate-binding protein [Caldilineaceae bacterium]